MFDRTNRTLICSVVFTDIVEHSKQPVAEQIRLKESFNTALSEALQDIAVNDRIILDTGDGAAISFLGDPEDALFVVMTLLDHCNMASDPSRHVPVRIGINLGPVKLVKDINGRPNLIGDGINVAQRIMSFAEPGQVMVSRSYYEVVSCLSESYAQLFQYVGARTDKHVREHEVYAVGYNEQIRQARPQRRSHFRRLGDTGVMPSISGGRTMRALALGATAGLALFVAGWLTLGQLRTALAKPAPAATPSPTVVAATQLAAATTPAPTPTPTPTPMPMPSSSPKASPTPTVVAQAIPAKHTSSPDSHPAPTPKPDTTTETSADSRKKHAATHHPTPVAQAPTPTPSPQPQPTEHKRCAPGECWANER